MGFAGIGIDWVKDLTESRKRLGEDVVLQGNLDPCLLFAKAERIQAEVKNIYRKVKQRHVFNLGGKVLPDTPIEGLKAFIHAVKDIDE